MNWGDALVVVSAALWAVQIILVGRLSRNQDRPFTIAFGQFAVTAALGIGLGFALEAQHLPPFSAIMGELLFTGVLSGALCFTLQIFAQRYSPSGDAAILMSTEALFAALGGALFFGERLDAIGWIGCTLIIGAVLLVQLAPQFNWQRASRSK